MRLWNLSTKTGQRPSDILKVDDLAFEILGVRDTWTSYQFDLAVTWFVNWVEERLSEEDPLTHKPLYTLNQLLNPETTRKKLAIASLKAMFGLVER